MAAYHFCKDVLVRVNISVDAVLCKSFNEALHLIQVSIVEHTWFNFNGFPHDAKPDNVEAESLQIPRISLSK